MPRGRRPNQAKPPNSLLQALKFISVAQRRLGAVEEIYSRLDNLRASASTGLITASHPIVETFTCQPRTAFLVDALESLDDVPALTIHDNSLIVSAKETSIGIPLQPEPLPVQGVYPDQPVGLCDKRLKVALSACGKLVTDGAVKLVNSSVQANPGFCVSASEEVIIQAWHGIDLMPLSFVPKSFVTALDKIDLNIVRVGNSEKSITIWFENGAWLRGELYPNPDPPLPSFLQYLDHPSNPIKCPDMFSLASRLTNFVDQDKTIYFCRDGRAVVKSGGEVLSSEPTPKGVPGGIGFSIDALLSIKGFCKTIHFNVQEGLSLFFGDDVRGAISTVRHNL